MPKLTDRVKSIAGLITAVAAAAAVLWAVYGHFHTDAEAAEHISDFKSYQKKQYEADKFDRIDRFEREIARVDFQLLSDDLSEKQREYLKNKRRDMEKKIECIRAEEC